MTTTLIEQAQNLSPKSKLLLLAYLHYLHMHENIYLAKLKAHWVGFQAPESPRK